MKAAAAVLGASLLFFLGVLTGTGRRESVPPPVAIPLGVVDQSADGGSAPPSSPDNLEPPTSTTRSTAGPSSGSGSPAAPSRPSSPPPTEPSTSPDAEGTTPRPTVPPLSQGTPGTTPARAAPPSASSTTTTPTTAGPGQVEEVDNEVDCSRKGKGRRESCPPTTATTERRGDQPGGGRDR